MERKPYLREVSIRTDFVEDAEQYPFNIPAISQFGTLRFHPDVTFLIGENGSGKSTVIEAIALALGFGPEGGTKNTQFTTAQTISPLHGCLQLVKGFAMPRDHYFLRAESFYNLATYMDEVQYLEGYGGKSLHARSHGEAFLTTLSEKLRGDGLYIFDEPEAALSPNRQLTALATIHDLVKDCSQLIIATHSPILMAYPRAKIVLLDETGIREVNYEDTEHYQVTKGFLNDYQRMLHYLLEDEGEV